MVNFPHIGQSESLSIPPLKASLVVLCREVRIKILDEVAHRLLAQAEAKGIDPKQLHEANFRGKR